MKTSQLIAICLFLVFITSSCFSSTSPEWDDDEIQTYEISNFERIVLEGGYKVILKQSDRPGLQIKADEEFFEHIKVDSDGHTLSVTLRERHLNFSGVILYVEFVDLNELRIEGGVKLETKGYVDLNDFYLRVEGGAKIEMEMKVDHLRVVGEGGVSFNFRGVAKTMGARISGAGHIDADELKTQVVTIEIEGIGGGSVYAIDLLNAKIEGVGKIRYKGNPEVKKIVEGLGLVSPE
ncbi:head GIN domain-containing protein [uncultured Sunxiuqinia sp.]|uniref:head GIN domain-containing protein n=1 Tax=uncultured Sunxiuqinia sp. TaxID=1573825 RepID=UPI0030DCE67A|tara:strand:+ start:2121 stop:2828 length:708 start_codon:yes stop_codon:yes gene_type:complete